MKNLKWNQYDVGVDNNDYTPISWDKCLEKITDKKDGVLIRL